MWAWVLAHKKRLVGLGVSALILAGVVDVASEGVLTDSICNLWSC